MSDPVSRPVVLDAAVLSNYASTDSVTWLTTTLDDLLTVPAVRTELEQGREVGYAYLEHALDVLEGLTVETADEWLTTWIDERNYYAPVDSVTAALPDDFEK